MNKIGIIGAMQEEVDILQAEMNISKKEVLAGMTFFSGELRNKEVVVVMSGIGKVNAAACAQILSTHYDVDLMVNTGVAGAIHPELEPGDLVISKDLAQHDMDVTGAGCPLGEIPRLGKTYFEADTRLIGVFEEAAKLKAKESKIMIGRIVSGDLFVSAQDTKDFLWEHFGAYCAEMEGAAIAQIAYLNQVPFVVVRAISDKADGSAEVTYEEFVKDAAKMSASIVDEVLNRLA
ncbi:MAG: 5'-methylthioadenosine/adenosylhomocysteine nucleosidase [Tissierellales bacterium]|jgi:adenosylhomocysteine nucleosidase|nr:5'-methylthioadenosine/adenosylhomocysteine nucleosidase [Tissierellales bacterium]